MRLTSNEDLIDVTGPVWNGEYKKGAGTFVPNDCVLVDNGVVIGTDTSTTNPFFTVSSFELGGAPNGPFIGSNLIIDRFCYWDRRLPNATLQAITV